MTFYIHRGYLEEHTNKLSGQIRQVRQLQNQVRQLLYTDPGPDTPVLQRCLHRLNDVEHCLVHVHQVLTEHMENTEAYSQRLSSELDDMLLQAQRVFE